MPGKNEEETQEQETVEQEAVEQAQQSEPAGEAQEQGEAPGQGESQDVEQPDPNLFDSDGKSWKAKAKEYERKYNSVLEKVVASTEKPQAQESDDEEIPATRSGVKQVLTELTREERIADQIFEETFDDILLEKPDFAQYKDELRAMLKTLSDTNARKNPETIKVIAKGLYGQKTWKSAPAAQKPVKKLVSTRQQDVMSPSPKSGAPADVELTEEEQEYAEHHRFIGMFDNSEIKDMFKKTQGKRIKQGG